MFLGKRTLRPKEEVHKNTSRSVTDRPTEIDFNFCGKQQV